MKELKFILKEVREVKNDVFAQGVCFYKLFWVFLVGCVVGVLIETLYCLVLGGNFEVRWGVIYGPFNPVYGFGAVIMTLALSRISKLGNIRVFLLSMFLGGTYEYLCSLLQEIALGTISWSYEGTTFSFGGRTNLVYSVCWGLLGLYWAKRAYPKISSWIESFPVKIGKISTWMFCCFMVVNMLASAVAVWRYSKRLNGIPPRSRIEILIDKTYNDSLLKMVYPNMRIVHY